MNVNCCQPQRTVVFFALFLLSALAATERALAGPFSSSIGRNRYVALRLYGKS